MEPFGSQSPSSISIFLVIVDQFNRSSLLFSHNFRYNNN